MAHFFFYYGYSLKTYHIVIYIKDNASIVYEEIRIHIKTAYVSIVENCIFNIEKKGNYV